MSETLSEIQAAAEKLRIFNCWRRAEGEYADVTIAHLPFDAEELGRAIDLVVATRSLEGVFEVVDATDEEQYWPLGVFMSKEAALAAISGERPPHYEGDQDAVRIEVRLRSWGFFPHQFEVIAFREWNLNYDEESRSAPEWNAGPLVLTVR